MKTFTIPQRESGSGTIHDISSDMMSREIRFPKGHKYAVVDAAYYGGKGYTTHKSDHTAAKASLKNEYSHEIVDDEGNKYDVAERFYGPYLYLK